MRIPVQSKASDIFYIVTCQQKILNIFIKKRFEIFENKTRLIGFLIVRVTQSSL